MPRDVGYQSSVGQHEGQVFGPALVLTGVA